MTHLPSHGPRSFGIPMPAGPWRSHLARVHMVAGHQLRPTGGAFFDVSVLGLELTLFSMTADEHGLHVVQAHGDEPLGRYKQGVQDAAVSHFADRDNQVTFATRLAEHFDALAADPVSTEDTLIPRGLLAAQFAAAAVLTDTPSHAMVAFAMVNGGFTGTIADLLAASGGAVTDRVPELTVDRN